jgi:hypothetical protein
MKRLGLLIMFCASLSFSQQSAAPIQLTTVPPKPTCNPEALAIFGGGPDCQDRVNAYNQAVQQRTREELQLYVNRQKELASKQATAPLQQQVADLNKLASDQQAQIKKLSDQIQADAAAALQAKTDDTNATLQAKNTAHTTGLEQGAGIGVGATLVLLGLIFSIKRFTGNFTVTKKPQAKAASA